MTKFDKKSVENYGMPSVSADPMKTVEMEGNFYRRLLDSSSKRSRVIKIIAVFLGLLFLMMGFLLIALVFQIPSLIVAGDFWFPQIMFAVLGLIFILAGAKIVLSNIK